MNLAKVIIILLEMLLVLGTAFPQNTSIGLRTGVSSFTLHNDEINDDAKYTMGLNLAIPFEYTLSPVFSIQPELHFIQKGVQFEELVDGQDYEFAVKTDYLELPVLLKANFGEGKFKYYAFVAPSLGFATNRFTVEKTGDADKVKEDINFIDEEVAKSQRWEFSASGGAGVSMQAGIGSIVLDVRYSHGLTDNTKFKTDKPDDWEKTSNRGCTLSVGYMVPLGRK